MGTDLREAFDRQLEEIEALKAELERLRKEKLEQADALKGLQSQVNAGVEDAARRGKNGKSGGGAGGDEDGTGGNQKVKVVKDDSSLREQIEEQKEENQKLRKRI